MCGKTTSECSGGLKRGLMRSMNSLNEEITKGITYGRGVKALLDIVDDINTKHVSLFPNKKKQSVKKNKTNEWKIQL